MFDQGVEVVRGKVRGTLAREAEAVVGFKIDLNISTTAKVGRTTGR